MNNSEKQAIKNIHFLAFGEEEGEKTAELVGEFLALPDTISINAVRDEHIVGNIIFTPFSFKDHPDKTCFALAPLGVLPDYQGGHGVGSALVRAGIDHLKSIGADAIFVLGVPTYYPQHGFVPTELNTPYPDLLTLPESWMILELTPSVANQLSGETYAVEPFMQPDWWDTSERG